MKKNKVIFIAYLILFITIMNILYIYLNNKYKLAYNEKINAVVYEILEKYPNLSKAQIVDVLNNNKTSTKDILLEYGINDKQYSILNQEKIFLNGILILNITFCTFVTILIFMYIKIKKKDKKRVEDIIKCMEQINNKNYLLDIADNEEDEISILKNEIYKTNIMLKEQSEILKKDKLSLKESLEDISHQLKTPLTSISIMLDNLVENPNIDDKTREKFLNEIRKEIGDINFLVYTLLKLSRFDANVVEFNDKYNKVSKIIEKVIKNVEALSDLKNVEIVSNILEDFEIFCDFNWQVEGITNIVKNAIEHSTSGCKVYITCKTNKLYSKIEIKNFGEGISQEDIKNIFKRFYKGKSSSENSIGIGLSLAKSIIEKDGGKIYVESIENEYTTFIIKYFN